MMSRLSVVVCCLSVTATAQLFDTLGEECFGSLNGLMRLGICRLDLSQCNPTTHAALSYSEVFGQDGGCAEVCCVEMPTENQQCAFDYDGTYTRGFCRDHATCLAENPSEIGVTQLFGDQFCGNGLVCCIHDNLSA